VTGVMPQVYDRQFVFNVNMFLFGHHVWVRPEQGFRTQLESTKWNV
jgi:hypothetical protein